MSSGLSYATHLGYLSLEEPLFRASVGGLDPVAHIAYAARLGFKGVLYPWAGNRPQSEVARVAGALRGHRLIAGCTACVPFDVIPRPLWVQRGDSAREELLGHVRRSIAAALQVGSKHLVALLAGEKDLSPVRQRASAIDNLHYVLDMATRAGLAVAVEPMIAFPDMLLQRTSDARELVAEVNHPHFGLVFDTGHVAEMDGAENVWPLFESAYDDITVIQLADMPGRIEPGAGVVDIGAVLSHAMLREFAGLVELEHLWSQPGQSGEAAGLERFRALDEMARRQAGLRQMKLD